MEITRKPQVGGRVYRVFPLVKEPAVYVEARELSEAEVNSIYDRHNFFPGSRSATMAKLSRVTRDQVRAMFQGWGVDEDRQPTPDQEREGFRRSAGFVLDGAPLEVTDENKDLLAEVEVLTEYGELRPLVAVVNEKIAEAKRAAAKN